METKPITPTEAHLELAKNIIFSRDASGRLLTAPMAAQLIADSEARALASLAMVAAESADRNVSLRLENDQLRAENKANQHELNEARNAERLARMQLDLARAERDAERARLDWLEKRGPWESWNGFGETGITLREPIRACIDAAMKEESK